jgi:REP element-mobilizing transposase RayT
MPKKRIYTDSPYLLTSNTKNRNESFRNFSFARILAQLILLKAKELKCNVFCYQIMPEHMHIIMQSSVTTISKYMQQVKSCFYKELRSSFGWKRKFWQKGFDYQILRSEDSIYNAVGYLGNNPGEAGLEKQYFAYPYAYLDVELINRYLY